MPWISSQVHFWTFLPSQQWPLPFPHWGHCVHCGGGWAVWLTPGERVTFWYPHSIQPAWEAQGLTNTRESTRSWWASWKKSQQYHTPGHEMLNQLCYSTVSVSTPHCMQPFIGCSVISLTTAFIKYCSVFCSGQFGPSAACMTHEFSSSSKTDRIQSVEEIK